MLLRLLMGTAWAMPPMERMPDVSASTAMSCHDEAMDNDTLHDDGDDEKDCAAACVVLCDVCCMGFMASMTWDKTPTPSFPPSPPSHPAQAVERWQHTPDLRPPISTL